MHTTYLKAQHEKAVAILGMIQDANNRADSNEGTGNAVALTGRDALAEAWHNKAKTMRLIASRLEKSYLRVLDSITSKAPVQ